MRWSSSAARGLHHSTTVMITNNNDDASEGKPSTGPATAAAVLTEEVFLGIDAASVRQGVGRFVLGEGVKPAGGMTPATLLARGGEGRKAGAEEPSIYERGP